MRLYPSALAFFAMLFATSVLAWEPTPGKPYNGKTVKALIVKSSQFEAHEARMSAFEEETGINMIIDYVPFPNMKEALTAEMIAGGGDYDVVSIMDGWVSPGVVPPVGVLNLYRHDVSCRGSSPAFLR